jgi:hypothetical protein
MMRKPGGIAKGIKRCLLCPIQLRMNNLVLIKWLDFLTTHPTDQDHAIIIHDLIIPFIPDVTSFFHGCSPTQTEFAEYDRIKPFPKWIPNHELYAKEVTMCVDYEFRDRKFRGTRGILALHLMIGNVLSEEMYPQ